MLFVKLIRKNFSTGVCRWRQAPAVIPMLSRFGAFLVSASCAPGEFSPAPFLLGGEYQLSSDLDEGGSVARGLVRARVSAPIYLGEDVTVALSANHQFETYEFDNLTTDPWEEIHRTRVGLIIRQQLQNGWTWIALPWLVSDVERGADTGDSLTGGVISAAWYDLSDTLKLGLGFVVRSRLEDNVTVFPIPIIDWEFADGWTFSTLPQRGFRVGAGASLGWKTHEDLKLSLVYQFLSNQQRLDEDSLASPNGVGEFRQHRLSLAATYRWNENLSLTGHAGFTFAGEIELQDAAGVRLNEDSFDASLIFGLEGAWSF